MKRVFDFHQLATPAFLALAAFGATACSLFAEIVLGYVLRNAGAEKMSLFALRFVLPVLLAGVAAYVVSREHYRHAVRSSVLSSIRTHAWNASLCCAIVLWLALENRRCAASSPCYPDVLIAGVELALSALAAAAADVLARLLTAGRMAPVA